MSAKTSQLVDHLFRTAHGKFLSSLTRYFGPSHMQLAEDVMQDTLISAMSLWAADGVPENPEGWLMQVAKRKALNEVKRIQMKTRHHKAGGVAAGEEVEPNEMFLEAEIEDNQLRMIFTCCHPSLSTASQISLTLKTLCGFGVREVANALLTTEATINKRLYRAKEKIRNAAEPFVIPQGVALEQRMDVVSLTLYLLFNEGYNTTTADEVVKKDLCLEAMRLTRLLLVKFPKHRKLNALLALMCFHAARFGARIDDHGAIILFEDQNRKLWDTDLIQAGMQFLQESIGDVRLSAYHIEARIAAEHCLAPSFDATNWQVIYGQYQALFKLKPNAIIQLNIAIINSKLKGIPAALRMLEALSENAELKNYHLLPATQGEFQMQLGNFELAATHFESALKLNPSHREKIFLEKKLALCKTNNSASNNSRSAE